MTNRTLRSEDRRRRTASPTKSRGVRDTPRPRAIFGSTYSIPAVLAVVSVAGPLFALVGDDAWDLASWVMLGASILIAGWFWLIPAARCFAR